MVFAEEHVSFMQEHDPAHNLTCCGVDLFFPNPTAHTIIQVSPTYTRMVGVFVAYGLGPGFIVEMLHQGFLRQPLRHRLRYPACFIISKPGAAYLAWHGATIGVHIISPPGSSIRVEFREYTGLAV